MHLLWISMWLLRWLDWMNDLVHCWHLCGFSSLWISMWLLKWINWVENLVQCWHLWGFSPPWINMWIFSILNTVNYWEHFLLLWGFSLNLYVSPEVTRLSEWFDTLLTFVMLLSTVIQCVFLEISKSNTRFSTLYLLRTVEKLV